MIKAITEWLFVLEVAGATLIIFVGIAVFATGGYGGNHFVQPLLQLASGAP